LGHLAGQEAVSSPFPVLLLLKSIDFTNLTHEVDPSVHCFNPSIAHWKGDLYLCCYRAFVRYPNQRKIEQKLDPEVDPNHPWLGGDQSVTWWNTVVRGDGTGFFIMQISQPLYQVKNVKKLNDGNQYSQYLPLQKQ
jgi:hypothetical protein